ncbi:hypothetical protein KQX54_018566 [Cotesia glomerata]|uniref:Uncharacterized protein n=1 Tax=Cotesia glomerata TaxID=32391 RepID=A0AAV7I467_COTGL|nr:hypothetical protein KQX54_018566 [Cotesia glomerata]
MNEPVDVVIGEEFPPLYAPRPPSVYIYASILEFIFSGYIRSVTSLAARNRECSEGNRVRNFNSSAESLFGSGFGSCRLFIGEPSNRVSCPIQRTL